jgi:APA family basic amino acid/polyamine antiporter
MFPKTAAEYVYFRKATKLELPSFLLGVFIIFAEVVAASTVALGFAGYFKAFIDLPLTLIAILLIASLSVLNFIGIKESFYFNLIFTAVEVFGLLVVIFLASWFGKFTGVNYFEVPSSWGIVGAAALIIFAYLGFEDVVNIAEETKHPTKNVPRALILSIIITTLIYIAVALAAVSLADWHELSLSTAPLAFAVSKVLGEGAFTLLSAVALFATANTVLILLIVCSRMAYGMGRAGSLPMVLSKIHAGRRTPWVAILIIGILSSAFVLLGDIRVVAETTNFAALVIFISVNFSALWLRHTRPMASRPFKLPLNIRNHSLIPFLGLASCGLLITQLNPFSVGLGILVLIGSTLVYKIFK